ncbi:MAG: FAD-binding protein [Deltaproteobacteria bacterium]|nr:FAD-binding protein [Deltaproteobacteria bacterium]
MSDLNKYGELFSADVLILGGGLAGLILANRIKELNSKLDVLIVEKATTGFSGSKANKGAGVMWVLDETDDADKFLEFYVKEVGHYLEDQEMVRIYAKTSLELVKLFEGWDIEIMRDENGKLSRIEEIPLWALTAYDLDIMLKLRNRAKKKGVRMVDKTQTVELLTDNNRVTGAVGFDITDGSFKIFTGKATIIANGSCNWMATNMWYSGRGDGIAAAYRAGAEMRNGEISNFYNIGLRGNMSSIVGGQYALYNDLGEYIPPKYCKEWEPDFDINIFLGMEKEVMEGRGPILFEETEIFVKNPIAAGGFLFKWNREWAGKFWNTLMAKEARYTSDERWRPEVVPLFIGEMGAISVDHSMRGTLKGMWALGDASKSGSGFCGATPPPCRLRGSGLTWAGVSAILAAASVVEYAGEADRPSVSKDQVAGFKETIFSPMQRKTGINPRDGIRMLQEVITPPRYSIRKNRERMEESLNVITDVYDLVNNEISPEGDFHMLGLCHDLRNMTYCSEIYMKSALERKETRGWHVREDYPDQDDNNWRKWITARMENGKLKLSTEKIPFQNYKYNPQEVK